MSHVSIGLERLLIDPPSWIKGRRLGLLCNQASVDASLRHAKNLINSRFPGQLKALFAPQHGLFAEKQDNMVESPHEIDPELNIPVYSLYSESREPDSRQLSDIDIFIVDIQDVGCRVYTFIWTMYLAMKACARAGVGVAVLDRPNPLGGDMVEGNLLEDDFKSFVGMAKIPMRHGMTIGELARLFVWMEGIDLDLYIIPMEGWRREMDFIDTRLPWVWPSPNMPTLDTARVYPGQVVLEGTNLSEGRGTTRPFEVFGAPYLDIARLKSCIDRSGLSGFVLREQYFEPVFHKWAGERCRGFQIHVTDRRLYRPYLVTLAILAFIARLHPKDFAWKGPPYEYEYDRLPADLIIGSKTVREAVDAGEGYEEIASLWQVELKEFLRLRAEFLLY
ncbi:MAG: exo-beta-N-acetylmuramidase NamZ family protein [Dissulfurimicrobium sp.]|uniref:exo-beta-N-acetylmuramidase NamZ family protein n=1 Tax=Dissulfurimicrobium sp. TaxID=2022436 RepID=UPI004049BE10